MEQLAIDTLGEVRKFAPKRPRKDSDPMDESGQAVLAMLQKAADLSMSIQKYVWQMYSSNIISQSAEQMAHPETTPDSPDRCGCSKFENQHFA